MMKLDISGVHYELDEETKKHVNEHVARLDHYTPRWARRALAGHVVLTQEQGAAKSRYSCEISLSLPAETLIAKESTANSMLAAVDMAAMKMKHQLLKYKTQKSDHRLGVRHLWRRLARRGRY